MGDCKIDCLAGYITILMIKKKNNKIIIRQFTKAAL